MSEEEEESHDVIKVDVFVEQVLARVAPLDFGIAQSPAELEAVYRLRYAVVIDQGWAEAKDFPEGFERDAFDDRAIQIIARDGGELVGTTRLVPSAPGCRLPTEQAFELEIASRGRVIDMGRTCRAPGRKDIGQRIIWGLLAKSWVELRRRGCLEICGIFSPAMIRFYRRLGFQIEILGPARL